MQESRITRLAAYAPAVFGGVVLLAVLVAVATAPQLSPGAFPAAVVSGSVFSLTNQERAQEGVPALIRNVKLDRAAQLKAEDMASKAYYAHVSPEGLTPMHFVDRAGYSYIMVGENLVVNRESAEDVVSAFMGSSGHRTNILRSEFTEIGVGVAEGTYKGRSAMFVVQIFAAPRPEAPKPLPTKVVSIEEKIILPKKPVPLPAPLPALAEEVEKVVAPLLTPAPPATSTATSTMPNESFTLAPAFSISAAKPIELSVPVQVQPTSLRDRAKQSLRAWVQQLQARFAF
ncbi:CAP domain-containing protein [Patescibacteria group bacterium]|nr:CAP domain-containing protein [Patescibacteria group bacterium]MBU2220535.1 CAP domain-containing protein [Patescibacteria group bacterium]